MVYKFSSAYNVDMTNVSTRSLDERLIENLLDTIALDASTYRHDPELAYWATFEFDSALTSDVPIVQVRELVRRWYRLRQRRVQA